MVTGATTAERHPNVTIIVKQFMLFSSVSPTLIQQQAARSFSLSPEWVATYNLANVWIVPRSPV